jgi:polar amino acid transport system substrate-binding protein/two-component system sensor histidine kinase EvgS
MMNTLHKSLTIAFLTVSTLISGFSTNLVSAQRLVPGPLATLTSAEQAWLAKHPEVVLGAPTDYPPMVIKRKDGTHVGVLVDFFELISKRLKSKIRLHIGDSWDDIQKKGQNREIDGLAAGGRDPSRKAIYNPTDALFPTYFSVFGRSRGEYQIKRFTDLDGMRIGYKQAASPTRSLLEKLPSATLKPYGSHESMTQALLRKEIDVIVAWMSYDHWRKQKMQGTIDNILIIEEHPIEMVSHIRKDWPELIPILNKVIISLQEDELPRLINKWFGQWPQQQMAGTIPLTAEEQAWLKKNPRIRLGTLTNQPPFSMLDSNGKHIGMLADFLALISDAIGQGIETELVDGAAADTHEVSKKPGNYGSASILNTALHGNAYLLTEPYFMSPFYIYVKASTSNEIRRAADLRGKRVAAPRNHRAAEAYLAGIGQVEMIFVDTPLEQMQRVVSGEADALIGYFNYPYLINKYLMVDLVMAFVAKSDQGIHIGVNPDYPVLQGILNKAIATISEEKTASIAAKWTETSREETSRIDFRTVGLTAEEQAWLDNHPSVRVRIADWPPYLIIKDDEAPQGIVMEYLKLIENRTGLSFKYEVTSQPFAEFIDSMKQRQGPDMAAIIAPTPEREAYLSFSETYLSSPYVIFVRQQDELILDISGLFGKTLAVPRGFVLQQQLARDYPDIRLVLFDSDRKALESVAIGQADAYIGNLTVASHIIHRHGFSGLQVAAAAPYKEQSLAMGNRNDWPELTSILNKALVGITEREKTAIRSKYLAIKYEQGIDKKDVLKWMLIIGGTTAAILLLVLFWNRHQSLEINRRRQTELALKESKEEAEAANRAKSIFLANMSHELRTPLNAILGFSRLLAQKSNVTADDKEKLSIIKRSGQHLLAMINDVLDLSKIEAGRIELQENASDLVALTKEIGVMIQSRAAEKGISVAVENESVGFPYLKTDIGKLRQIMINLLNNAVRYTDEGRVTIRCATEVIPEEPEHCSIVIEVEDTGPGIDLDRQKQIFEPFVQGIDAPVRKGTGLGLSICKRYADFMGGTIEVESEVGKGSLFRLRLPAEIAEAAAVKMLVDDRPQVIGLAPKQRAPQILVADDNRENMLLLKSLLEAAGFLVLEAENGKEAVTAFERQSPDLIWMDMRMPVMDGYEAVRQIRMLPGGDKLPIIAITASAFGEQREEILATGCDEVVIKPFVPHEIFEVMGRYLNIEYVYEPERKTAPSLEAERDLTSTMLADLPAELLQELRAATLSLDSEAITSVIERIEPLASDTAKSLRTLLEDLQMRRLQKLIEKAE